MYQLVNVDGKLACIKKIEGNLNLFIPTNEDNTDYQQYLKWVEAGNTPLPADEQSSGEAAKGAA